MAVANQTATAAEPVIPHFALLDAMRGVAVLAVACFHFHGLLTHEGRTSLFGPILDWVAQQGHLGEEVFFVISGFVLAHALRRLRMCPSTIGRFLLRRAIRLLPAYWVVLLATFLANGILTYYGVIHRPAATGGVILANMFLVQDIFAVYAPVSVAWFLCAEVQFYLLLVSLLWAFQWLRTLIPLRIARLALFGPPALASLLASLLAVHNSWAATTAKVAGAASLLAPLTMLAGYLPQLRGVYLDHWHLFFLGTVLYWSLMGVISAVWFWAYIAVMMIFCNGAILGGVGTGLVIIGLARLGLLDAKKRGRFLPYVGSRSYSFFLVHVFVGSNLIRLLLRQQAIPETFLVLLGFFAVAMIGSFIAAEILYRLIERPTHRLAQEVAWESPAVAVLPHPQAAGSSLDLPAAADGLLTAQLQRRWPGLTAALRVESAWLIPVCLLALIWLTEMYVVQDLTLAPGHHVGRKYDFFAPKIRFLMDVCFVGATMSLLRRNGLFFVAISSSLLNLVLLTYYSYFLCPLSLVHIVQNRREAMELSPYAWDLLNGTTVLSLSAVLMLKLLVIRAIPAAPRWRYPAWMGFFGVFSLCYVMLFVFTNLPQIDPLETIVDRRTLGQVGVIRGYLGPWIAELYYLNDERLRERALERREFKSDQLTPVEYPLPIEPRLVIIQVETLDQKVIGHRVRRDGETIEVTPFLNQLRDHAMYYRARVFRFQGSCDSDFTMMANVAATARVNAYYIPDYPYNDANASTLPMILKDHGYETIAFHGYPRSFYNRGTAFNRMGFKRSLFQEALEQDYGLPVSNFGILDEHVLRLSSHKLREAKGPICHFIITLSSHTPYKCVVPNEDSPFPRPANSAEDFFNSMRYVDDCLREYIESLPKHTTVVIYGDHTTEVRNDKFTPDKGPSAQEFVPVFIYDTDRDLNELQRTRNTPLQVNGKLNLLDISTFLRNRITAVDTITTDGKQPAGDANSPAARPITPKPASSKSEAAGSPSPGPGGGPIARRQAAAANNPASKPPPAAASPDR